MKMIFLLKLGIFQPAMLVYQGVTHLSSTISSANFAYPSFANRLYHHFPTGSPPQTLLQKSPGEKRNATEIMHAYVGSGLEVLADKGAFVWWFWEFVDGC